MLNCQKPCFSLCRSHIIWRFTRQVYVRLRIVMECVIWHISLMLRVCVTHSHFFPTPVIILHSDTFGLGAMKWSANCSSESALKLFAGREGGNKTKDPVHCFITFKNQTDPIEQHTLSYRDIIQRRTYCQDKNLLQRRTEARQYKVSRKEKNPIRKLASNSNEKSNYFTNNGIPIIWSSVDSPSDLDKMFRLFLTSEMSTFIFLFLTLLTVDLLLLANIPPCLSKSDHDLDPSVSFKNSDTKLNTFKLSLPLVTGKWLERARISLLSSDVDLFILDRGQKIPYWYFPDVHQLWRENPSVPMIYNFHMRPPIFQ